MDPKPLTDPLTPISISAGVAEDSTPAATSSCTLPTSSAIICLFQHKCNTPSGLSLHDIRAMSDEAMERNHDYVQYFFPSEEQSAIIRDAPVVTERERSEFSMQPLLRYELLLNLRRMLVFWSLGMGFEDDNVEMGGPIVDYNFAPNFFTLPARHVILRSPFSSFHNFLRVTRVIKSLHSLGLRRHAEGFHSFVVSQLGPRIGAPTLTMKYWHCALPVEKSASVLRPSCTDNAARSSSPTLSPPCVCPVAVAVDAGVGAAPAVASDALVVIAGAAVSAAAVSAAADAAVGSASDAVGSASDALPSPPVSPYPHHSLPSPTTHNSYLSHSVPVNTTLSNQDGTM